MNNRFAYQELDRSRSEIRLLELQPKSSRQKEDQPACRLHYHSLDRRPRFQALSYVWGDPKDRKTILVDDSPFRVTRNLFEALINLTKEESVIIWIDAICINQEDEEEKSWQVQMMSEIYQRAFEVIAWLGPAADNSDSAIDYLNKLGCKAEACGFSEGPQLFLETCNSIMTEPSYMDDPLTVVLTHSLHGRKMPVSKLAIKRLMDLISGQKSRNHQLPLADLERLFRRKWWGRVWVLQEITVPDNAYFVCGTRIISRERFKAAFNAYYVLCNIFRGKTQRGLCLTPYERSMVMGATHRVYLMLSMPDLYIRGLCRFSLVSLLRATCVGRVHLLGQDGYQHLESTDSRDKIFALLSLASDREELEKFGLLPDYKMNKEEVHTIAAAALLKQGHISILSIRNETRSSLPSWVPDWSEFLGETFQDVEHDHATLYPKFSASGRRTYNDVVIVKKHGKIQGIRVRAKSFYTVLDVGAFARVPRTGALWSPFEYLYTILRLSYSAEDIYSSFKERLRSVVRTSHAGTGWGELAFLERMDLFYDALPIFKREIHKIAQKDIRKQLQDFLASKEIKNLLRYNQTDPPRLEGEFRRVTRGRSPFVTKKGRLGLGFQDTMQGDCVALIAGAQVPFILRRCKGDKYRIIGEAYVDGIMDGEAAEGGKWEHIELV